jgi:hypothetical protein
VNDNLPWLVKNGHPKWKTVDLNYPLKGWEQYGCVKKYLGKAEPPARAAREQAPANPVMDAIKQILGD